MNVAILAAMLAPYTADSFGWGSAGNVTLGVAFAPGDTVRVRFSPLLGHVADVTTIAAAARSGVPDVVARSAEMFGDEIAGVRRPARPGIRRAIVSLHGRTDRGAVTTTVPSAVA